MNKSEKILLEKVTESIEGYQDSVEADPYRLKYHIMPPVGLLNDPNGFIQFQGIYHLFYQWNPLDTAHGAKFWGHYTSSDLVHWEQRPIALSPSDWFDKNGCYSGSAVEKNGKMLLFYTGNVKNEAGNRETYQCLATSEDGFHFEKKGPIINLPEGYTAHFRDPKVWKKDEMWYMVIGAQSFAEEGKVVLFYSSDLTNWKHLGPIAGSNMSGLGEFGYMWECPDLFHLDGKDVLLMSPQGLEPEGYLYNNLYQSGYLIGEMDYENVCLQHGAFTELDRGFDFYAPQTTIDQHGRRLMFGWMGLPEENESYHPSIEHRWIHAMTLPRKLELKGDKLYQKPVEEMQLLRKNKVCYSNVQLSGDDIEFDHVNGDSIELLLDFIKNEAGKFEISFRGIARLSYDAEIQRFTFERRSFKDGSIESRHCKLTSLSKLQLFLDTSSIEIFVNDGVEVFTARIYPDINNQSITFSVLGDIHIDLTKWNMVPAATRNMSNTA